MVVDLTAKEIDEAIKHGSREEEMKSKTDLAIDIVVESAKLLDLEK